MTDAEIYAYFGLTLEEIGRIETNQPKGGLSDYIPLKAPDVTASASASVMVPESESESTTADASSYAKMTITELKKICKEKNIKGLTGKKKHELIQIITQTDSTASAATSAATSPTISPMTLPTKLKKNQRKQNIKQ